jgi:hydroxymethylcytosylglucuronate/cytosylglucuronate synthase
VTTLLPDSIGLLVASVDFGYGSSGKLASIVDELAEYRCVLAGSTHSRQVTTAERFDEYYPALDRVDEIRDVATRHRLSGALVVLNPDFADLCVKAGLETVYVDSLPYLWTDFDPVPFDVAVYCAQHFPFTPDPAWRVQRRIRNLRWVDGIVPRVDASSPPTGTARPFDALVNLGGVGTHLLKPVDAAYPGLILEPVLRGLARLGLTRIRVTGNVVEERVTPIVGRHTDVDVTLGPVDHLEFQTLMRSSSVLLTSPGLTTLIESGALGCRTVVLPSQNLSQFFNADAVALCSGVDDVLVRWPRRVIDRDELERVRQAGEDAALRFVYAKIADHADDSALVDQLTDDVESAVRQALSRPSATADYVHIVGRRGAEQVAAIVRETIPKAVES